MDSLQKYSGKIQSHLTYHEQGAAFAACGYAQASGKTGVAYATSGPGATNLITGICNAFFDSVPVLFLTGQVNCYEGKDGLGVRQRGFQENRTDFSPNARLIRIDIDSAELDYRVKEDEISICADLKDLIEVLSEYLRNRYEPTRYMPWIGTCEQIQERLKGIDEKLPNEFVKKIGDKLPDEAVITTDVGQNQVWVAQSLPLKKGQRLLFSGGHGAMGYSLPAAIGAFYASKKPIVCFNGDGGFQMNIQELMVIAREKLPIKMIVLNNRALGMIRHFQEMYFFGNYTQTVTGNGYAAPDFGAIAAAYGLAHYTVQNIEEIDDLLIWEDDKPVLLEVCLPQETYVYPKVEFGKPNQDQEPLLDRALYDELMQLDDEMYSNKKTNILRAGGGGKN